MMIKTPPRAMAKSKSVCHSLARLSWIAFMRPTRDVYSSGIVTEMYSDCMKEICAELSPINVVI